MAAILWHAGCFSPEPCRRAVGVAVFLSEYMKKPRQCRGFFILGYAARGITPVSLLVLSVVTKRHYCESGVIL